MSQSPQPPGKATEPTEKREDSELSLRMAAKLSRAAEELKGALSVGEEDFRLLTMEAHGSSRDFFVFEALDEVQKAVVAVLQTHELLEGEEPDPQEAFTRIVFESGAEGLALRQRKLIETLADVVGFAATPEDAYFRDYLLHVELDRQLSAQRNLLRFYGAESLNLAHQIDRVASSVEALEADGLDTSAAWYRRRRDAFDLAELAPGRVIASFARRFDHALALATDDERAGLGFSYGQGFGRTSDSVHARPGDLELLADAPSLASDITVTVAISLSVLTRCQETVGMVPTGENEWLHNIVANNEGPSLILQNQLRGKAEVGDIVMAADMLAQVLEIAEGSTGYRSYRVRYLSSPPLADVPEDWHIAQHVRLVLDPRRTREMVRKQAHKHHDRGQGKLLEFSDAQLMEAIGEAIAMAEKTGAGMREAILAEVARRRV